MDDKLVRQDSNIDGFGIFASIAIPKGVVFYKIPLDIIYSEPKTRCARIADNMYVDDDAVLNWINHSCNPNAMLDINRKDPRLVSVRDILPGEEISVDYNQTEIQGIKVECTCRSKSCKGYFKRL